VRGLFRAPSWRLPRKRAVPPARRSEPLTRLANVLIGSHVSPQDPLAAAEAEGADVVQIFLGNPQSWQAPKPREDAAVLKAAALPIYVHAPYLINVASANNRVRIPSRKILQQTCDAAADIGAAAVIGVISGNVLGLAASNGWTRLGWGACAVILLFNTLVPRRTRTIEEPVADHRPVARELYDDIEERQAGAAASLRAFAGPGVEDPSSSSSSGSCRSGARTSGASGHATTSGPCTGPAPDRHPPA